MYRLAAPFVLFLLLAGRAFGYQVAGYYYTGAINGKLSIQMSLRISGTQVYGAYQYVSRGQYLSLDGTRNAREEVRLRETDHQADERKTGSFTGTFTENRHRFTGVWRSADGTRSFPFSLQAVAEYRRLTKQIKLDAEEAKWRKEEGQSLERIIEEVVPHFYQATPALTFLNRRLWNDAVKELLEAGKEKEGEMPLIGTSITIQYLDKQLLSLSDVVASEGGVHADCTISGENYLIAATKPTTQEWDTLLTVKPELRAELLKKVQTRARELATDDFAKVQKFAYKWEDLGFSLNAQRLTIYYPREIGHFGSYDVELPYEELAPYLSTRSIIRQYLR